MPLAAPLNFSLFLPSAFRPQALILPTKFFSLSPLSQTSFFSDSRDPGDDYAVGDSLVFEDGIFNDPYIQTEDTFFHSDSKTMTRNGTKRRDEYGIEPQNLVPDEWRDMQAEVNLTKKDRRKIAQQLEFGVRVEKKKQGLLPLRNLDLREYTAYREAKLDQLNPLVLDKPSSFPDDEESGDGENGAFSSSTERVNPKNPRWAAYGKGFDHVTEFFNSGNYEPGVKKSDGPRKLFTKEEKILLNSRIPDLAVATSRKWLPLHTLAASGEFYLVDSLLKHNVDINAVDRNGLTALNRAIMGKKQAIANYLLRESANPLVVDEEGATLLHYAVQTASAPAVKLLLLHNVDINCQDNDGWTPLHVAVQSRRTDMVKLLLIKGANRTLKNKDGLTPLELCLYSGREARTYELIKLLKEIPGTQR